MTTEQASFRKGRDTRNHFSTIRWIVERSIEYKRPIYIYINCVLYRLLKAVDCVDPQRYVI